MQKLTKTKYLAMPISRKEKKSWNKKGYRVVDKKYDPLPPKKCIKQEPEVAE
jgi:hypothetical protein